MDLQGGRRPGASCYGYSKLHKKLIIPKEGRSIVVLDLDRKVVEMEISTRVEIEIEDFRLFGEDENKVVFISAKGLLQTFSLNYDIKKICSRASYQIELDEDIQEAGLSVAVCDKNKYILADVFAYSTFKCSRTMLFELNNKNRSLVRLATLDQNGLELDIKFALSYWRAVGKHLIWVGLSRKKGHAHLYDFDTESGELRELVQMRVRHEVYEPWSVHVFGNDCYYIGEELRIMRMTLRT